MPKKKLSVKKNNRSVKVIPVAKKNNSNKWILIIAAILLVLGVLYLGYRGMSGNVVAGNVITGHAVSPAIQSVWTDYLKPVLEYLVGQNVNASNTYPMQDFFSMALLILVIVFSIVFVILKSMPFFNDPEHGWSVWVVSIAVSLLAVRFLTQEWLITILLPYSTLAIAISAGLPFVLYYFLVKKFSSDTMKKIAWIFFGIIFLYLWYDRTQTANTPALAVGPYYGIYGWTALAALIMALIGQKAVEKVHKTVAGEKGEKEMNKSRAHKEYSRLHEIQANHYAMMEQATPGSPEYNKSKLEWEKVTKRLAELQGIINS